MQLVTLKIFSLRLNFSLNNPFVREFFLFVWSSDFFFFACFALRSSFSFFLQLFWCVFVCVCVFLSYHLFFYSFLFFPSRFVVSAAVTEAVNTFLTSKEDAESASPAAAAAASMGTRGEKVGDRLEVSPESMMIVADVAKRIAEHG